MRQDVSDSAGTAVLFRRSAVEAASQRIFGSVTVVVPPSGAVALLIAIAALALLAFVAWYVEIPQRARAAGVLMPPEGLKDILASAPGRVGRISVEEGQRIEPGELLLEIDNDRQELASYQLESLRAEISLLDEAHARQQAIDHNRLQALDGRLESLGKRLAVAKSEYELQQQQIGLIERRLSRRENLAGKGSLSPDLLDEEQGMLLTARTRLAAIRHSILEYEGEVAALSRSRSEAGDESIQRELLNDLERRRLRRQLVEQEHRVSYDVRASEPGVVARINVQPGATVTNGEPLVKVYRPYDQLEAWLYLSSDKAGFLKPGQAVELRLDAYPHEMFGTRSAVVTSISRVAIVPREVRVPLAINGPVFEVRARFEDAAVEAFDTAWPLAPGTSFQADLVQRRFRLYEWLLRHVVKDRGSERA